MSKAAESLSRKRAIESKDEESADQLRRTVSGEGQPSLSYALEEWAFLGGEEDKSWNAILV